MDLLDALKKKSSGPEKASPGKAEQLFEQYLHAREEGDTDFLEYVADAANYLGTMYADGLIDGRKDPEKAVECYKRATELSDRTLAWYNLGMAYAYGNGVPKNRDKAIECLRHAAKFDDKAKEVLKQLGIRY